MRRRRNGLAETAWAVIQIGALVVCAHCAWEEPYASAEMASKYNIGFWISWCVMMIEMIRIAYSISDFAKRRRDRKHHGAGSHQTGSRKRSRKESA